MPKLMEAVVTTGESHTITGDRNLIIQAFDGEQINVFVRWPKTFALGGTLFYKWHYLLCLMLRVLFECDGPMDGRTYGQTHM